MMIPKCTRSTFSCWATGTRIAVNIRISTVESMNVPAKIRKATMISMTTQGVSEIPSMNSASFWGI